MFLISDGEAFGDFYVGGAFAGDQCGEKIPTNTEEMYQLVCSFEFIMFTKRVYIHVAQNNVMYW